MLPNSLLLSWSNFILFHTIPCQFNGGNLYARFRPFFKFGKPLQLSTFSTNLGWQQTFSKYHLIYRWVWSYKTNWMGWVMMANERILLSLIWCGASLFPDLQKESGTNESITVFAFWFEATTLLIGCHMPFFQTENYTPGGKECAHAISIKWHNRKTKTEQYTRAHLNITQTNSNDNDNYKKLQVIQFESGKLHLLNIMDAWNGTGPIRLFIFSLSHIYLKMLHRFLAPQKANALNWM